MEVPTTLPWVSKCPRLPHSRMNVAMTKWLCEQKNRFLDASLLFRASQIVVYGEGCFLNWQCRLNGCFLLIIVIVA